MENEVVEQQAQEFDDDAFDADFESGFADDDTGQALGANASSTQEQPEQVETQESQQEEAQIQQAIEDNPHLTESQVRELFEHNNQRIYGKFGEVQREVKRLQELAQQSFEQQANLQPVQVTADMFSNMREEFGEDFANALARDLSNIPLGGSQGLTQAQLDALVEQRTQSLQNDFEMKIVAVQHPDWQDIAASDDFNHWKSQLPESVQHELNTSWDSAFISRAMTAYKSDRDAHQKALQEAAQKQAQAEKAKQKKLQGAVMPQSSSKLSDDFDDEFLAGFNEA